MAGPAVLFREIHRLRRFAHDLKEQLDRFPRLMQAQQTKVKKQEEAQRDGTEGIKKLKVAAHEKEGTLKSANQQIEKWEQQLQGAGSKKEYDALKAEITHGREKTRQVEDEILALLTEIDERTTQGPALEQAVAKAREEYSRWEKTAKERAAEQSKMLAEAQAQIKAAEMQIPENVRNQYNRLVAAMGPDALAVVKNRGCVACATEIIADHYNELLQGQFVSCTACGRILYLPE